MRPLIIATAFSLISLPAASAAPSDAECLAQVHSILLRAHAAGPHRIEVIYPDGEVRGIYDIVPGVGFHTQSINPGEVVDITVIGDRGWTRLNDGAWEELPPEPLGQAKVLFGGPNRATIGVVTAAMCDDATEADGQSMLSFHFTVGDPADGSESILYAYPDTRWPIGVVEFDNGEYLAFRRYTYDPSITVTPPAGG